MQNNQVQIAWFGKHFGEEPPLVGNSLQGAGAIFFSRCHLKCVYCQNFQISQENLGRFYSVEQLSRMMLELQTQGAVNIDLVSPTIWWQQIKEAIIIAKDRGLILPIVWNSNAYESVAVLKELDGVVDIYLPDFKYGDNEAGLKYSKVKNYSSIAQKAVTEMFRQVGCLQENDQGVANRGLIVRHLVLPNQLANSYRALDILSQINQNIHISLMNQFSPLYLAKQYQEINQSLTVADFNKVVDYLWSLNLKNGWCQEPGKIDVFIPDFSRHLPFD